MDLYVENGYVICLGINYLDDYNEYEEVSEVYMVSELLEALQ